MYAAIILSALLEVLHAALPLQYDRHTDRTTHPNVERLRIASSSGYFLEQLRPFNCCFAKQVIV